MAEDEMVGRPHRLNGHDFELTVGVGDRQGGLASCSPWGPKESDTTERLSMRSCVLLAYSVSLCMCVTYIYTYVDIYV